MHEGNAAGTVGTGAGIGDEARWRPVDPGAAAPSPAAGPPGAPRPGGVARTGRPPRPVPVGAVRAVVVLGIALVVERALGGIALVGAAIARSAHVDPVLGELVLHAGGLLDTVLGLALLGLALVVAVRSTGRRRRAAIVVTVGVALANGVHVIGTTVRRLLAGTDTAAHADLRTLALVGEIALNLPVLVVVLVGVGLLLRAGRTP